MKTKTKNLILTFSLVLILLGIISFFMFNVQQTFYVEGNQLKEYTNSECNLKNGNCEWVAYLPIPNYTKSFSYFISQDISPCDGGLTNFNVKYSIFNYKTNAWESIFDKTYNIADGQRFYFTGEGVYDSTAPIAIGSVQTSASSYMYYYACLKDKGFESQLPATYYGKTYSSYRNCLYPGDVFKDKDYDDEEADAKFFEVNKRLYATPDYIKNNKAMFKIIATQVSSSCSPDKANGFWVGQAQFDIDEPEAVQTPVSQVNETIIQTNQTVNQTTSQVAATDPKPSSETTKVVTIIKNNEMTNYILVTIAILVLILIAIIFYKKNNKKKKK